MAYRGRESNAGNVLHSQEPQVFVDRRVSSTLLDHARKMLGIDLAPPPNPAVHAINADLQNSSKVFNSFILPINITEPFSQR
ncbi:hypothetical protein K432DRAFT_385897 [Lepidopterella palustris CBS 459.81]|uniref:Uncharacterized protein n=1 Tax=Lepidopterella palustris CBS 459.81 TaxID=1314670 RepID=A0A8E2E1W7_9PEZI|nr:hypothetical protein K432DRAFT_385897 [Lepidopterella palustris CBS 459.81]